MAKITKQEIMSAFEYAAVVLIGGILILAIPIFGPLVAMLPSFTIWIAQINLPAIVAGALAILAYTLIKAKLK